MFNVDEVWDKLDDAYNNKLCIKARVTHIGNGGLFADIDGVEAYIPGSEIDTHTIRKYHFDKFIGQVFDVKLLVCNRRRKNLVVSRRKAILEK